MIRIEGLTYRFRGSDHDVLHDVNLAVEPGEFLVITGPSGCGKSTLALAIGSYLFRQFDGQAEGSVTVASMDVRQRPIYDVAEVVGLVQQNPETQFCTLTVHDEVAFGLENRCLPRQEIRERMDWALSIVSARHLQARPLATLSGGEKQKVAIAAMMAAKPQVLIFDEPTSNLDPTATAEIFGVIQHIREKAGITVLVIEHKVDYLRAFQPRLVAMDGGRVVYDGPMTGPQASHDRTARVPPAVSPTANPGAPLVGVSNLCAGYDGHPVLRGVSLEVQPGEFVSIMGDNGSGKSTFLKALLGLLRPQKGHVEVLGQDTRRTAVSRLARQAGFVFQNPDHQLFADTVCEEATFAPRNFGTLDTAAQGRIGELLHRSGLGDRLDDHPYRLSYGQKRRLNLVSVLSYGPPLTLLDEVLIGQDPRNAAFLMELLRERVQAGGAVLMVNHAPVITRQFATRLLFFQDGELIVDAPPEEAFGELARLGRRAYLPSREVRA
jgi:energy-coupling factor transporter ATP-binding protein EcfA2